MSATPLSGCRISLNTSRRFVFTCCILIILLLTAVIPCCYSASDTTPFDFDSFQGKIRDITREIKGESASKKEIEKARKQTDDFLQSATECIDTSTVQIGLLDQEILSLGPVADHEPPETVKERGRLTREKQSKQVRISECRLISTLAARLKNELADRDKIRIKSDFLSKTEDFYGEIWVDLPSFNQFKIRFTTYCSNHSGLHDASFPKIFLLLLLMAGGGFSGREFFRFLQGKVSPFLRKEPSQQVPPLKGSLETTAAFAALAGGGYLFYICRDSLSEVYGPWLFLSVVLYGFSMSLFHFHSILRHSGYLPSPGAPPLLRIRLLVALCLLLFFSTRLNLEGFTALNAPFALAQSIIILAVCLTGWSLLWSFDLPVGLVRYRRSARIIISMIFILVLMVELSGYRNFSIFLLVGLFSTYLLSALLRVTLLAVDEIIGGFHLGKYRWQQRVRQSLGISSDEILLSVLWLGFIFKLLAYFTAFFLLLQAWGLSNDQRKEITSYLVNGLHFGGLVIAPARILMGVFVFACCWTFVSWIKLQLEKKWLQRSHASQSVQETLVTATGYAGFALAFVIGLSIAGVSFSNLAVIAGALSVGIGFGLQNIVNNFVSGLIILFERPVKRGDWISVGNTEGYVQKISVRSTLIQTFDRSDVIVPNSELISNQVTNMMLNDRFGRLVVPIGVAYGSDTDQVRTILLDIAKTNPRVVNDGSAPQPQVLFLEFGESSLNFELRCHLSNIDDRFVAKSEINYDIDREFRKHNVSIPFPQRDVYIKETPSCKNTETGK
jgi:potassium-dependent mechanosensitive channel